MSHWSTRGDQPIEVEGRSEHGNGVHSVTFRLEIARMKDVILRHVTAQQEDFSAMIDKAVMECLSKAEVYIAEHVAKETRRQIESMVSNRVNEIIWSDEFRSMVDKVVKKGIKKGLNQ